MDEPLERLTSASPYRHLQGVEWEVCAKGCADPPADDETGKYISNKGRVGEPLPGPHIGQVGHPQAVGGAGGEVAFHQILWSLVLRAGRGRAGLVPAAHRAGEPELVHEAGHLVPAGVESFTLQLPPHLLGPIDVVVLFVHPGDLTLQPLVFEGTLRRAAGEGGVVGGRGELQNVTDRLDPEPGLVVPNEADYFVRRRSSSAPKKAEAAIRISLARRSSLISRWSSAISWLSAVVNPGRAPVSISACLTHERKDSVPTPSWRATRPIIPWSAGSSRRS
jgi:hypothetical protein